MKYVIAHECRGRIRIRIDQKHMSLAQADLLEAWLQRLNGVQQAVVHERTCCAVIRYSGTRADLLQAISRFRYDAEDVETLSNVHSGRAISRLYQEKLVDLVCFKLIRMVFFPQPLRILWTIKTAVRAAPCGAAGRAFHRRLHSAHGFLHGRFRDVPAAAG